MAYDESSVYLVHTDNGVYGLWYREYGNETEYKVVKWNDDINPPHNFPVKSQHDFEVTDDYTIDELYKIDSESLPDKEQVEQHK